MEWVGSLPTVSSLHSPFYGAYIVIVYIPSSHQGRGLVDFNNTHTLQVFLSLEIFPSLVHSLSLTPTMVTMYFHLPRPPESPQDSTHVSILQLVSEPGCIFTVDSCDVFLVKTECLFFFILFGYYSFFQTIVSNGL